VSCLLCSFPDQHSVSRFICRAGRFVHPHSESSLEAIVFFTGCQHIRKSVAICCNSRPPIRCRICPGNNPREMTMASRLPMTASRIPVIDMEFPEPTSSAMQFSRSTFRFPFYLQMDEASWLGKPKIRIDAHTYRQCHVWTQFSSLCMHQARSMLPSG
jgi:hypothetical protein